MHAPHSSSMSTQLDSWTLSVTAAHENIYSCVFLHAANLVTHGHQLSRSSSSLNRASLSDEHLKLPGLPWPGSTCSVSRCCSMRTLSSCLGTEYQLYLHTARSGQGVVPQAGRETDGSGPVDRQKAVSRHRYAMTTHSRGCMSV